jgi:hypothetical protein
MPLTWRSGPWQSGSESEVASPEMSHPAGTERPGDWYSLLRVDPVATTEQISAAVERLSRQANALSITAPERARQLRDQIRTMKRDLLSGAEQRERYDHQLAAQGMNQLAAQGTKEPGIQAGDPTGMPAGQPAPVTPAPPTASPAAPPAPPGWGQPPGSGQPAAWGQPPGWGQPAAWGQAPGQAGSSPQPLSVRAQGLMSRVAQFLQTGWTCSACGFGALPTDKFCPKCGSKIQSGLPDSPASHGHAHEASASPAAPSPAAPSPAAPSPAAPSPAAPAPAHGSPVPSGPVPPGPGAPGRALGAESAFCYKCRSRVEPGDVFCARCGAIRA